ncbi:MAG: DUF929 family protein [Nitrososphaerales archaeon]
MSIVLLLAANAILAASVYASMHSSSDLTVASTTSKVTTALVPGSSTLSSSTSQATTRPTTSYCEGSSAVVSGGTINDPISAQMYSALSGVSCSTLSSIGIPSNINIPKAINGTFLTLNGKPDVLYVGAEFCPFSGAERWALIVALSKFGTFSGLDYMLSSSSDVYPNTPTFTFLNATYVSQYISFTSIEAEDRYRSPLQQITPSEQSVLNQYDKNMGIPFIDIANQFLSINSQYSPSILSGANWSSVGNSLSDPRSTYAQNIDGAANSLVADICAIDGWNPANVCSQSFVKQNDVSVSLLAVLTMQQYSEILISTLVGVLLVRRSFPKISKTIRGSLFHFHYLV